MTSLAADRIMMRWKEWRELAAVGIDDHAHGDCRPVLVWTQRAEVVGDALRQHRHDAVGKIDGIAAHQRLAVERAVRAAHRRRHRRLRRSGRTRRDWMGPRPASAWTASSWSLASAGSMVTSGRWRQSSRPAERRRPCRLGLGQRVVPEDVGDVVRVDGDQLKPPSRCRPDRCARRPLRPQVRCVTGGRIPPRRGRRPARRRRPPPGSSCPCRNCASRPAAACHLLRAGPERRRSVGISPSPGL